MKVNINKYYLLVKKMDDVVINLGQTETKNSECEKLLGIKADTKLTLMNI